jgi:hypothetical protein
MSDGSLFGSPPPSPVIFGGTLVDPANVGPIALPGSHTHAELPLRPPTASLLPPGAPQLIFAPAPRASAERDTPTSSTPSRSTTRGRRRTSETPAPPKTTARAPRTRTLKPPPAIAIPSADEPIPSNFLRSQKALLGHAGMIGAVHPTQLPQPHTMGLIRDNPIVVEPDVPHAEASSSAEPATGPTQAQVLQALVKDKEAVATLSEILRLAAENKQLSSGRSIDKRPSKRRRLSSSAALDADKTREANQARLKRMVGRLVVLIQEAARRATRDLAMHRTGHYRPATAMYGQSRGDGLSLPEQAMDTELPMPSLDDGGGAMSEDFMSSFEAFMGGMPDLLGDTTADPFAGLFTGELETATPMASGQLDLASLDQLLNMIQSLPDTMDVGLPSADPVPVPTTLEHAIDPALLALEPPTASTSAHPLDLLLAGPSSSTSTPGMGFSPLTSAASLPDPLTPRWDTTFPEPSVYGQSLRKHALHNSIGSFAHGVYSPATLFDPLPMDVSGAVPEASAHLPPMEVGCSPVAQLPMPVSPPNLSLHGVESSASSLQEQASTAVTLETMPTASSSARPTPGPARRTVPAHKTRSAIVARAKERKKMLEAELERAKIELWEATIEGGALTHLLKAGL